MGFWEQVLSPGGLAVGLVGALLGALTGHFLTRFAKRTDDRQTLIEDVANKYRDLRVINKTSGPDGLLKSGVCRLNDTNEIEQAITIIQNFGNQDPLLPLRQRLVGKDICRFFVTLRDKRHTPLQVQDIETALKEIDNSGGAAPDTRQ